MIKSCCVYKCNNKADKFAKAKNISFFRFPADKRKRLAWIKAINRENFIPNQHSKICSEHFIDGWHSDDPTDKNYVPTLFSYKMKPQTATQLSRDNRRKAREQSKVS